MAPDGTAYVGSEDGGLRAVDASGMVRWQFQTAGAIIASARIDAGGRLYVGSRDDVLYALDRDGAPVWRYNLGSDIAGANRVCMDSVWFNPGGKQPEADIAATHTVSRLSELLELPRIDSRRA